jgi:ABC-type Na+ transport system ATPase subunit NatA
VGEPGRRSGSRRRLETRFERRGNRIFTTLVRPTTGRATVAALDVVADAPRVRGRIGLTGRYATVDGLMTGRANLSMIGRLHRLGRAAAPTSSSSASTWRPPRTGS